jgi:hypothetical protein
MPVDRKAKWIEKYGDTAACRKWLEDNPPPAGWTGTPQEYAFEEGPIDFPLEVPDGEEPPIDPPAPEAAVTRREHDALREQVARVAKGFNRAIKKKRAAAEEFPPAPRPPVADTAPVAPRGLAAILAPLKRR